MLLQHSRVTSKHTVTANELEGGILTGTADTVEQGWIGIVCSLSYSRFWEKNKLVLCEGAATTASEVNFMGITEGCWKDSIAVF